jgi:hypothetical protein
MNVLEKTSLSLYRLTEQLNELKTLADGGLGSRGLGALSNYPLNDILGK